MCAKVVLLNILRNKLFVTSIVIYSSWNKQALTPDWRRLSTEQFLNGERQKEPTQKVNQHDVVHSEYLV